MSYYYFSTAGQPNLDVDNNAISLTFPQIDRAYTAIDLFSDGAIITGNGAMKAGQITFSMKFKKFYYLNGVRYSAATTWHAFRYSIMTYMGLAKYQPIYFNIQDASGNILQQQVYPITRGSENYGTILMSDELSLTFQMAKAYFYNTTAHTSTYSVTSTQQEIFSVANNGVLPVAPLFTFTPSTGFSSLQIQLYYGNYGFTLATTFLTGQPITFDCSTSVTTQNGNVVTGIQSAGSIFEIPPGTVSMYITACTGTLVASINERYF